MLATIHIELAGEIPIARLVGEVDASNAAAFTAQLKEAVPNSAHGMVLDLCETTYIDSSGLHLIFDLSDALRRRQQSLQLVVPADTFVSDVLGAVSMTGIGMSSTREEALEAVTNTTF